MFLGAKGLRKAPITKVRRLELFDPDEVSEGHEPREIGDMGVMEEFKGVEAERNELTSIHFLQSKKL